MDVFPYTQTKRHNFETNTANFLKLSPIFLPANMLCYNPQRPVEKNRYGQIIGNTPVYVYIFNINRMYYTNVCKYNIQIAD